MDTCVTEGCENPRLSRGRCSACYQRGRRAGKLPPTPGRHVLTEVDLEAKVATCSQCGPSTKIKVGPGHRRECRGKIGAARKTEAGRAAAKRWAKRPQYSRYGLSEKEFAEMRDSQKGRCAICQSEDRLVIDHDHDTGAVRGLLCHGCNVGLGFFRDDPSRLEGAIAYLA